MIKMMIWGIGGRMGRTVLETASSYPDIKVTGGFDKFAAPDTFDVPVFNDTAAIDIDADVIVDFSRAESIYDILPYAKAHGINVVLATTGHTEKDYEIIKEYAKDIAIFKASNMSLGINLLLELVRKACDVLKENYDIEIIEQHHNVKVDAPSGTALTIAKAINAEYGDKKEFVYGRHSANQRRKPQEIGIHAVRGGTIVGKHDVMFIGKDEIVTVAHEAQSKAVFAVGALRAAQFIADKQCGIYDMPDMINTDGGVRYTDVAPDKVGEVMRSIAADGKTVVRLEQKLRPDGNYDITVETK